MYWQQCCKTSQQHAKDKLSGSLTVDEETTLCNRHGLCRKNNSVEKAIWIKSPPWQSEESTEQQMNATWLAIQSPYYRKKQLLLSKEGCSINQVQKGFIPSWASLNVGQVTSAFWFPGLQNGEVALTHHFTGILVRTIHRRLNLSSDTYGLFLLQWHSWARSEGSLMTSPRQEAIHTPPGPNGASHRRSGE